MATGLYGSPRTARPRVSGRGAPAGAGGALAGGALAGGALAGFGAAAGAAGGW